MSNIDYVKDIDFLTKLVLDRNTKRYTRIIVLDKDEFPIDFIQGRVTAGTISISGSSSIRRTCNLTFVASEKDNNNLSNVDNLLSLNKKIKIEIGVENNIDPAYDALIWFPQGIYVISQPSISHNFGGVTITLSCKDKMCLLNGENAGGLPSSITFHEYDQYIGYQEVPIKVSQPNEYTIYYVQSENKYYRWSVIKNWYELSLNEVASQKNQIETIQQRLYDIVLTLVCNYGGEPISNIYISDLPLQIKQIVRYVGSGTLWYNPENQQYTISEEFSEQSPDPSRWKAYKYNDEVGYIYTDLVYPGELISNIGESVTSVLDKICSVMGNFEYFYDIEGRFIFREKKNYLNNSYDITTAYRLDNANRVNPEREIVDPSTWIQLASNNLYMLNELCYKVDFNGNTKRVFTFSENFSPVISYSNAPKYSNIKNDYHIWGKNKDGYAIHYHLAIKSKPNHFNTYSIVKLKDSNGEFNGRIRLATSEDTEFIEYTPEDWRAELYLQGLTKQSLHQRPDVYEQELLDLFDSIYNMAEKKFKTNIVSAPNNLNYFLDYIEPVTDIMDYTVEEIGRKTISEQQDKIVKLFNAQVPNVIILDRDADNTAYETRCQLEGEQSTNVEHEVYETLSIGAAGYSAEDKVRELLYINTNYNESISIQTIPIYFLDVNTRISVQDIPADITGDFIINSISLPLDPKGTMTITASRALERI